LLYTICTENLKAISDNLTIVLCIIRGKMMEKKWQKMVIVSTLSMICLCILGTFIPAVSARDSFAPSWLKEGTYATYTTDRESGASIFNTNNDPQYRGLNCWNASAYDEIAYWNATLTWRCTNINDTTSKLQVTFNYTGKTLIHNIGEIKREPLNNASLQITGEAYVDLYTRAVYTTDGTLLGTTHLWLPANPTEDQDIAVWDLPPEKVTLPAKVNSVTFHTPQGIQDSFLVQGTTTINGKPENFNSFYDLDTGLMVGGLFEWDPIMAAIGIRSSGLQTFSDTNIQLGSNGTSLNWTLILQYAILPIAVILLGVAFVIKRKKKRN